MTIKSDICSIDLMESHHGMCKFYEVYPSHVHLNICVGEPLFHGSCNDPEESWPTE